MPDIYTDEWYEAVKDAINESAGKLADLPEGSFIVAIEISADGLSPYVDTLTGLRRFVVKIERGTCSWYKEVFSKDEEYDMAPGGVNYRFIGPARAFDEIAGGLLDPVDAALKGVIRVRGDMRFLMRHAENVKVLLEAYTRLVQTNWPLGKPPYLDKTPNEVANA